MEEDKKRLWEWIEDHRDELILEFREFLRIPSLTGEEGAAQEFVAQRLRSMGIEPEVFEPDIRELFEKYPETAQYPTSWQPELDLALKFTDICTWEQLNDSGYEAKLNYRERPNVVGVLKGHGGGKSLLLNGHVDVVTVGNRDQWTREPFGAEQEDGRIFGRGASDMKGGLWACLCAMQAVLACGVKLKGNVIFQSVVNEEHSGNGTLACVAGGYTADAAICAEPTGSRGFGASSGGGVYWEIAVKGCQMHTGARWKDGKMQGVSAIEKMAPLICALREQEERINREKTILSLGIGVIQGGCYATATAADCTLSGVIYYSPDMGVGEKGLRRVKEMLRSTVSQACAGDPWLADNPPELSFLHYDDAYVYPRESPFLNVLKNAAECVTGAVPEALNFSACDARHLGNRGGIPTVVYGPGSVAEAHGADESVAIDEIIEAIKVMAAVICDWCNE